MAKNVPIQAEISLNRAKVFDELVECYDDLSELTDLIPPERRLAAVEIVNRMCKRMHDWTLITPAA